MCFGSQPLPYGEPIGPPDQKKYVELWMINQVMTDRQKRRTGVGIGAPSVRRPSQVSSTSPIADDDEDTHNVKLGD